ncbi:prolyl oligopeptidase family serine peptidase [Flavivirga aquimarina]|uniref:Prolyl oligopeptidase family serine peptidase n=1 Tax=Flavivirga aquimarina TaxID=2027862 RepID=A0ABT8W5M0_9FLAO|nr:prolyl oligopeptidase family serine peptidase [Flavivirga aquimarina]MDO5968364.1 prolyl oligopeptidase family serine peptidase [Flavivirga aquimarina]
MKNSVLILLAIISYVSQGQTLKNKVEESLINKVLVDPSPREIKKVLRGHQKLDLSPKDVIIHDSIILPNTNRLYVISHKVENNTHYGAVIIPIHSNIGKLPVIIFASGGDGMHIQFDIRQDFNHKAVQFPNFLGENFDDKYIIVIPSFRGQQLIIHDKKYQSEGNVGDAFDGATTDAIAFLNTTLKIFDQVDKNQIAIYGGSRGGTVALLASARDKRIKKVIAVACPTDMKALYSLYPDQFKLLFFNDLLIGKISESEARKKFISSSPIYFLKEFPTVQLHHDINDPFVPVDFARRLVDDMTREGKTIDAYFYEEGIHGFWDDRNYWKRVQEFIRPLLD